MKEPPIFNQIRSRFHADIHPQTMLIVAAILSACTDIEKRGQALSDEDIIAGAQRALRGAIERELAQIRRMP